MALPEAVARLSTALRANQLVPASSMRDRQELSIRLALATAYFSLLGWVAIEVFHTPGPARDLARGLGDDWPTSPHSKAMADVVGDVLNEKYGLGVFALRETLQEAFTMAQKVGGRP